MQGLMQEIPLNIPMLVRHAERMNPRKTVSTRTADGVRVTSYAALILRARRLAAALRGLGVGPGDRVFSLLGRIPDLAVAALGALKNGSVFCPLFSAFGPEPVATRMRLGTARVLVTTEALYRKKVAPIREQAGTFADSIKLWSAA